MTELFEYFGIGIDFLLLLALIELTLVIVFIVLALRYLSRVPKILEDIAVSLRLMVNQPAPYVARRIVDYGNPLEDDDVDDDDDT